MGTIWGNPLPTGQGPKYKAVAEAIRRAISDGQLGAGAKLPPVRELAYQLGITPGTVARAYTVLTDAGVLEAAVGRGTFVAGVAAPVPDLCGEPIEIDVIAHNTGASNDHDVNLFSPHLPNAGQTALIRQALAEVAQAPPSGLMHYPSQAGTRALREAVVRWLGRLPLGPVDQSHVVLANGGQNAISLVMQAVLTGRRPVVLVEELAYPGFRRAAELLRAEVVPVAMDEHGLIPEALEAAARAHDAQLFCTTPEAHNPTGIFTPEPRRQALARIARRHDMQILEDACYQVRDPQAPSYRVLAPERTWFVASVSKSLTPALRFGFGVAPEGRAVQLRRAAEDGFFGVATPMTDLLLKVLSDPALPRIEDEVRDRIQLYLQSAVNILGRHDLGWQDGAPFIWVPLPTGWRAGAFCMAAERAGVKIRPAEDYACRNSRSPHAVRLAVNAGIPLAAFESAVERLRDLLDNPPERIDV